MKKIKLTQMFAFLSLLVIFGCKEEEFEFGEIKSPVVLDVMTLQPQDTDADFGSGEVTFTVNAENALSYLFYPGDGTSRFIRLTDLDGSNSFKHTYANPGFNTYNYSLVVNGQGGISSNYAGSVEVFKNLDPKTQAVIDILSGNGSKSWKWDNTNQPGWYGVGPGGSNLPADNGDLTYWWAPSGADFGTNDCLFNDVLTFSFDTTNFTLSMDINNGGDTWYHDDYTPGIDGGSNTAECHPAMIEQSVVTIGDFNTELKDDLTTGKSIELGGDGFLSLYIANSPRKYEILAIDCNSFATRVFFWDDEENRFNAWYQRFTTVTPDTDCTAVVD